MGVATKSVLRLWRYKRREYETVPLTLLLHSCTVLFPHPIEGQSSCRFGEDGKGGRTTYFGHGISLSIQNHGRKVTVL